MSATAADVADDRAAAAAAFLPPPMTTAVGVVTFSTFKDDSQLPDIMALMSKDLSEPYSIFTYRHFSSGFPQYCILAHVDGRMIGAILCKTEALAGGSRRAYIGMLAVEAEMRRYKIGSALASTAITRLAADCDEIVLETEATNTAALRLYESLGFVRDKRLPKYYLNGNDAFRLKCWVRC